MGGTPETDFLIRTSDQPVYLQDGPPIQFNDPSGAATGGSSSTFTNGRQYPGGQRFDRDLGYPIELFKRWQLEAIKQKREHLEFKIKRALDYSDQLQNEKAQLTSMIGTITDVNGQLAQILSLMNTPGAANVVVNATDVHGFGIGVAADTAIPNPVTTAVAGNQRGNSTLTQKPT